MFIDAWKMIEDTLVSDGYDSCDAVLPRHDDPSDSFLIFSGWEDVAELGRAIMNRYPREMSALGIEKDDMFDIYSYANLFDTLIGAEHIAWGFSDEYDTCAECGRAMLLEPDECFTDAEYCYRCCYDCLDDDYYIERLTETFDSPTPMCHYEHAKEQGYLEAHGFEKIGEYAMSYHSSITSTPLEEAVRITRGKTDARCCFMMGRNSDPFTTYYYVYREVG